LLWQDSEDEFKIERVLLLDFSKAKYKIDFDGNLIEFFKQITP